MTATGAIVGAKMRYAHGEPFIRDAIADAGLTLVELRTLVAHREPRAGARPAGGGAMNIAVTPELPDIFTRWFASRGWAPRAHQLELLRVARAGRSALLIAPTGAGKTLAGFLPSLVELSGARPKAKAKHRQASSSPPAAASAARAGCTRSTSRR